MATKPKGNSIPTLIGVAFIIFAVYFVSSLLLKANADLSGSAKEKTKIANEDKIRRPYPTTTATPTITPSPTTAPLTFYLKTTGNITAQPGVGTTSVAGCEPGDIALSGGLDSYGGPINKWRTIRSSPSNSTDMNGIIVTVLNEDTVAHDFTLTAKCLKQ